MYRISPVVAAFCVLAAAAAAQPSGLAVGPGMVGPGSPLYGLEVAADDIAMGLGLANRSMVIQERAAELQQAHRNGRERAMRKAARQLGRVADDASAAESTGLERAATVLSRVRANASSAAQPGLQTAMDRIEQARQRSPPTDQPGRETREDIPPRDRGSQVTPPDGN